MTLALVSAERQRQAASPAASVWVSASAGAGKTKVLTDRVLRLLLEETRPERILCLTFTKAAAAEMSLRLRRRLLEWAVAEDAALDRGIADLTGLPPSPEQRLRARRLFATVLDVPAGPTIQTIHAFCQSVLRRFPIEAEIAPHFEVADERTALEERRTARDALLRRIRGESGSELDRALATLAARTAEQRFDDVVGALLSERGRLARLPREGLPGFLRERLGLPRDTEEAAVLATACCDDAFDLPGLTAACEALRHGTTTEQERAALMKAWLEAPDQRTGSIAEYCGVFFKKTDGSIRSPQVTKGTAVRAPDAEMVMQAEAERLWRVQRQCNALAVADATAALVTLARGVLEDYDRRKRRNALLDYDDLVLDTRAMLERSAAGWVHFKLDGGIDHVLIDEAQDTNPDQWAVVAQLALEFFAGEGARGDARTVFAVGDRKQSIFSFQRADPERSDEMRIRFRQHCEAAKRGWNDVALDISYRSVPAVLRAVDAVFAGAAAPGVVPEGDTLAHRPSRAGQAGLVEVWPLVGAEGGAAVEPWRAPTRYAPEPTPEARLAEVLAATIHGWIASGERLPARDRSVRAGDVMVLVRHRTGLIARLVRHLKERGVPVAGVDRMVLTDQLAVADLLALCRFLLLPEDDLTLATVLRSPLGGLDEEDLFALAAERGGMPLWRRLGERAAQSPGSSFALVRAELEALLARADFVPPYELLADLLGPRRGRERLLARLGAEANDPIDMLLAQALDFERTHVPSLQGFVHWMEAGEHEVKRDLEQGGRDEVRIITVHGAKGLQAPIVILPDTTQLPRAVAPPFWLDGDEGGLVLWPPRKAFDDPVCSAAREAADRRRKEEHRRLLYVAMTRAEDRLYVCGWCKDPAKLKDESWYSLIRAPLAAIAERRPFDSRTLAPGAGWTGEALRIECPQTAAPVRDGRDLPAHERPRGLPRWASAPARPALPSPRALAPSQAGKEEPPVASPLSDSGRRYRRGILVHRLLQTLPELVPAARAEAARRYLDRAGRDLPPAMRAEIAAETLAVLAHAGFAPLFGPGSRAEVPLTGAVGGTVVAGQVDRLRVTSEEVLVIDYKSNRPAPRSAAAVPPAYLRQMAAYRALLAGIYPGLPVRCALLWTETPLLMPLAPELLDQHDPIA